MVLRSHDAARNSRTSPAAPAQQTVSYLTDDGGVVYAEVWASGDPAVVLAQGGHRFNRQTRAKQAQILVAAGFRALALGFRGYGGSHGPRDSDVLSAPLYLDVLAATRYLKANGAKRVSIVGGSMGASVAADASNASQPGEIDRLVLLGAAPNELADKLKSPVLRIDRCAETTPAARGRAFRVFRNRTKPVPRLKS